MNNLKIIQDINQHTKDIAENTKDIESLDTSYKAIASEMTDKFDEVNTSLETNVQQLNVKINEVATKGTTTEVLQNTTQTYIQNKINDGTIANLTIKGNSITNDKIKHENVSVSKVTNDVNFVFNELMKKGKIKINLNNVKKTWDALLTDKISSIRIPFKFQGDKFKYFVFDSFNAEETTNVRISIKNKDKETLILENTQNVKQGTYEKFLFDVSTFDWTKLVLGETYYFCIESLENKYLNYTAYITNLSFDEETLNSVKFLYNGVDFSTYKMGTTLEHTGWYYFDFDMPNKIPSFYLCEEYPYNLLSIDGTNVLDGKSALFFGDSTCAGSGDGVGGWQKIIQENNPTMTTRNCGMYGADWFQAYQKWFVHGGDGDPLPETTDYVVIQSFVNGLIDYPTPLTKQLGEIPETYPTSVDDSMITSDTHCATMERFIYALKEKYPTAKFLFIISYKMVNSSLPNSYYRQFIPYMKKVCDKYSIKILNLFEESGIQCYSQTHINRWFYNADGVHINLLGYKHITPLIENTIKML